MWCASPFDGSLKCLYFFLRRLLLGFLRSTLEDSLHNMGNTLQVGLTSQQVVQPLHNSFLLTLHSSVIKWLFRSAARVVRVELEQVYRIGNKTSAVSEHKTGFISIAEPRLF